MEHKSISAVLAENALDDAVTAMCLESRPRLFALARMDYEVEDAEIIAWLLVWDERIVVQRCGFRNVNSYETRADFMAVYGPRLENRTYKLVSMDGRPMSDGIPRRDTIG
ncbi:hypothetical protein KIK06_09590 [Nocardiopsis sp. EMB25]|uniref:hypothetical protein n=1 Tax=Nocardiopsis TaxID=2013 RepID=UPI00034D2F53|nr:MULTISPECIES: hypothetical protein [Nocardiopsis]MCY9784145.1 hypothetical protein [Nocardiopsis sp. EMB25]